MSKPLTPDQQQEVLAWLAREQKYNRLAYFKPYKKQLEFLAMTKTMRETLLMAGNQLGKTEVGAFKAACHMTGIYPDWWPGRRWDRPTRGWIAGETSQAARDVQQKKLCGEPGVIDAFGTGMIPKDLFVDKPSLARGVTDAYDTIQVRHVSGGVSVARFKSYEQGRQKFQGESLDWIWFDEEPDPLIYNEGLTRTTATGGIAYMTFTPLKGRSVVVLKFLESDSPDRGYVTMTIDDVIAEDGGHITAADRARILGGYDAHEREARAKGVPLLGSGVIFTASEASVIEAPLEHIPAYWTKIWGIDFGMGHPFAAVLLVWDRDNDIIHVHHAFRMADALIHQHVPPMLRAGALVPVAWPHDGHERDPQSGDPMATLYKKHGLKMHHEHATFEAGGYSTEAGLAEMDDREKTGRLKYASHLSDLLEERRFYHRKEGKIVKIKDDIISAVRIGVMMKRFARPVALGPAGAATKRKGPQIARDVDFDPWNPNGDRDDGIF